MLKILILITRFVLMDVKEANQWAAIHAGDPSLVLYLDNISWRESKNTRMGRQTRDNKHENTVHTNALRVGWLSYWCPFHWATNGMSTNGPHGMMYAYNIKHAPFGCMPTHVFALPIISAVTAVKRYYKRCRQDLWKERWGSFPRDGWCPRNFVHPRKEYVTISDDEQEAIMTLIYKDGDVMWYQSNNSVFKHQPGEPTKFVCKLDEWAGWLQQLKEKKNEQDTTE